MSTRRRGRPTKPSQEPDPAQGMVPLAEFEAAEAERSAEKARAEAQRVEPLLPELTDERLQALKAQARQHIAQRLASRRRQRQLMRGAEQERRA